MNDKINISSFTGVFAPKDLIELKKWNLAIEELERKYSIKILFNGFYYKIYNIFGELWFTSPSLEQIEKEMKNIYKEK